MSRVELPKIVLLGDSLTQVLSAAFQNLIKLSPTTHRHQRGYEVETGAWVSRLSHKYIRKAQVVNLGLSGYNTEWYKNLLTAILPTQESTVACVVIFFGANDCVLADRNPHQHVPLQQFVANLKTIIRDIRLLFPSARLVVVTPPPVHIEGWAKHRKSQGRAMDRSWSAVRSYRDAVMRAFATTGNGDDSLLVMDTWELFLGSTFDFNADSVESANQEIEDPQESPRSPVSPCKSSEEFAEELATLYNDGLHFAARASELLFRGISSAIAAKWPGELDPEQMSAPIAFHDQVDRKNLPMSLLRFSTS